MIKLSYITLHHLQVLRVLITGAAGQIAYSLIGPIAKGEVFGSEQPIELHLLDIPQMMGVLNGVVMEIQDCSFPLLKNVVATDNVEKAFHVRLTCYSITY